MSTTNKKIDLKDFPTLAEYTRRIGAEQLNFRTFMIKENSGNYYVEKILIRLSPEGEIKCSAEGYDPTPEEARAIEHECKGIAFPGFQLANEIQLKDLKKIVKGEIFVFYKRNTKVPRDNIIMVQERRNNDDGSKKYLPWTYYTDGEWRCMEPEGSLPFYKPQEKKSALVMIHEGAKSAAAAQKIVESPEYHPWKKELSNYDHWGIIGGALAVHRADYNELKTENPIELVYVCDNDAPGMNSLPVVSKAYGKKMSGVYFDQRWPASWDIADKIPDSFFDTVDGEYIGPQLSDLKIPATWATREIENNNGKKKLYAVTEYFAEEWLHSVTPAFFVYHDQPHRKLNEDEFNNLVRPFSDAKNTAELLVIQNRGKAISLSYDPSKPCGMVQSGTGKERTRVLNTHVGGSIKPSKGDPSIFLEYMEQLFPEEKDRKEMTRWMATIICCPEIKIGYGVLLISEKQGVGKSTIGEKILANIIGKHNVSKPSASDIVDGSFNSWLPNKRLAIIDEMYEGHSFRAYNKMKKFMTEPTIEVNEKFTKPYVVDNWCHIFATSNNEKALKIDNQDRRWLIPKVGDGKPRGAGQEWWVRFYNWMYKQNGLGIIIWHLNKEIKDGNIKPVGPEEQAPLTEMKKEIIGASESESTLIIKDVLNRILELKEKDPSLENTNNSNSKHLAVRINDIRDYINDHVSGTIKNVDYKLKIEPREIRRIASSLGFYLTQNRMNVKRTLDSYVIVTDSEIAKEKSWAKILDSCRIVNFINPTTDDGEQQIVIKGVF